MKLTANYNTIPINVIRYVVQNDLVRAFSIFLYLKNCCDGVMPESDMSFSELGDSVGIKDKRTIQKYLKRLLSINWIGFNKKSRNYFIRGFQYIKQVEGLKGKHGVRINVLRS